MPFDETENLFSYGTLQSEAVQLATFGRRLKGEPDQLIGYRITMIPISNHKLMATSGATHHRNIQSTGSSLDIVEGSVFLVTRNEIKHADVYERSAAYKRVLVQLASGKTAWVYLSTQPETDREETP